MRGEVQTARQYRSGVEFHVGVPEQKGAAEAKDAQGPQSYTGRKIATPASRHMSRLLGPNGLKF
jgi:hypothetical protein